MDYCGNCKYSNETFDHKKCVGCVPTGSRPSHYAPKSDQPPTQPLNGSELVQPPLPPIVVEGNLNKEFLSVDHPDYRPAILPETLPEGVRSNPTLLAEQFDRKTLEEMVDGAIVYTESLIDIADRIDKKPAEHILEILQNIQNILHVPAKTVRVPTAREELDDTAAKIAMIGAEFHAQYTKFMEGR